MSKKTNGGTKEKSKNGSTAWKPVEREIAIRMRAGSPIKDIAKVLEKTPKSVERFFERIGLSKDEAIQLKLEEESKTNPITKIRTAPTDLKTTWGESLLVRKLRVEFGLKTPLVPVAILPDIHAGMEDMRAIELACKIINHINPVMIFYLGDNIDAGWLSDFTITPEKVLKAQQEIDTFHKVDRMVASAAGKHVRRHWVLGNHETRLYRWICKHPNIASLRSMQPDALFALDKHFKPLENLQLIEEEINWRDRFIIKHGTACRSKSCYTARAELEREGISGISGHTHRVGAYYERQRDKAAVWYEGGCLCTLDPEYVQGFPNWQHAINIGWFNGDGSNDYFHIDQVVFSNYRAVIHGKSFQN